MEEPDASDRDSTHKHVAKPEVSLAALQRVDLLPEDEALMNDGRDRGERSKGDEAWTLHLTVRQTAAPLLNAVTPIFPCQVTPDPLSVRANPGYSQTSSGWVSPIIDSLGLGLVPRCAEDSS